MSVIPVALRRLVIRRAENACEYCGLSQKGQEATFHIDHVIPRMAGGETRAENLALACVSCSLRKAARQTAVDPYSGADVPLYNPVWSKYWNALFSRCLRPHPVSFLTLNFSPIWPILKPQSCELTDSGRRFSRHQVYDVESGR
jgi:HNH endonuclease